MTHLLTRDDFAERLHDIVDEVVLEDRPDLVTALADHDFALRVERDRYREALDLIVQCGDRQAVEIARKALEVTP